MTYVSILISVIISLEVRRAGSEAIRRRAGIASEAWRSHYMRLLHYIRNDTIIPWGKSTGWRISLPD
jgi:hypothetical protein